MVKPLEELVNEQNPPKYREYNFGKFFASRNRSDFQKQKVENIQIDHFRLPLWIGKAFMASIALYVILTHLLCKYCMDFMHYVLVLEMVYFDKIYNSFFSSNVGFWTF